MLNDRKSLNANHTSSNLGYSPELDGLRAVAIIIVLIGHFHIFPGFPAGFGVTIFFFISGLLITTIIAVEYQKSGRLNFKNFYYRRFLRINPPLWITMAFALLVAATTHYRGLTITPISLASQALFFSNYFDHTAGLPIPLWSLAVEEHFYLFFPLFYVTFMQSIGKDGTLALCILACATVLCIRLTNVIELNIIDGNYYWTHTRIDSILFGSIYAIWRSPLTNKNKSSVNFKFSIPACATLVLISILSKQAFIREGLRYTLQGIAITLAIPFIFHEGSIINSLLKSKWMVLIGQYSYSLYLIHYVAIYLFDATFPESHFAIRIIVISIASAGYAALVHKFVERPLAKWRRRLV